GVDAATRENGKCSCHLADFPARAALSRATRTARVAPSRRKPAGIADNVAARETVDHD
ncbi:TPA: hypothetical protein L0160_005603, partial [Klebsiella oxytoca]|nr:hypothetical protein [Klebsiella oxytoca]